jgi:polysaccharide biosynthesis/export protein
MRSFGVRQILILALAATVPNLRAVGQMSARKEPTQLGTQQPDARIHALQPDQQTPPPVQSSPGGVSVADYTFGPGDIMSVQIAGAPEFSGTFQVTNTGYIAMPSVGLIKAGGLKSEELSQAIANAYTHADLLHDPIVTIFIQEYHSRTVLVLGAVARPSSYPLERPTTLLEVISMAGGLAPNAGDQVTVSHHRLADSGSGPVPETLTVSLSGVSTAKDAASNIEVQAGDVVTVSLAPVVYVVGAVQKPGGFILQDPASGTTVLQAIALAEGLQPTASKKHAIVLRSNADAKNRQEIPVDLSALMEGKIGDQHLLANDILFIPQSKAKMSIRAMGSAAETAAIGVSTYGLGLRLGRP